MYNDAPESHNSNPSCSINYIHKPIITALYSYSMAQNIYSDVNKKKKEKSDRKAEQTLLYAYAPYMPVCVCWEEMPLCICVCVC